MRRASIGLRLTLWYAALLSAALAIFSILAYWQLRSAVFDSADAALARMASGVEKVVRENTSAGGFSGVNEELSEYADELQPGVMLDVRLDGRQLVTPRKPAGAPVDEEFRGLARHFLVAGRRIDVEVRLSIRPGLEIMRSFRRIAAVCAPLLLLFSCGAGYWISRRALRPVDEITRAARSISALSLSQRLPAPRAHDELRRLSEAWNEMLARLEASVQRLSRFTADASHEMRSPLAVIRTTAELALRRERTDSEYRSALAQIQSQAFRLSSLVEDLLALARAEQDPALVFSPVDLAAVVGDARSLLDENARKKEISVAVDGPAGLAMVAAHEPSMRRLVLILLDNAIKFSPAGGRVLIRILPSGPAAIELAVKDDGPGIAAGDLPHIFERFYRADVVRTPGATGAGLGLSIAQSIAESHHTRIDVETPVARGSVFRVTLPAWAPGVNGAPAGSR